MQKLLIGTDFSAAARYAYTYAEWLAVQFKAQLIVVHVAPFPHLEDAISLESKKALLQKEQAGLMEQLIHFSTPYPNRNNPAFTAISKPERFVRFGKVAEQIELVAEEQEVDALIIGTRSKHSFWEHLFGSVSTAIIQYTQFPLLIIPEKAAYQSVTKIGFATAIQSEEALIFPKLLTLAKQLGAKIQSFFINTEPSEETKFKEEPIQVEGIDHAKELSAVLMIRESSVLQGISYFLEKYPCEMLALYVPNRQHFEQFFHRSISAQAAYKVPIPMLILKAKKPV